MMGAISYWGLPVFVGPMSEDTGWSHASIMGGLAARFIVGAIGGFLLGHVADKRGGAPILLLAGIVIEAASLIALRWVDSSLEFVLLYGVLGGAGNSGMRLVQATLVAKWFVTRRGTAVGFSSNGGGVSALIMVPIIAFLISAFGWRDAFTALAVILIVLLLPCVPLAIRAPEDIGLEPDNGPPAPSARASARPRVSAATERSYTLREVLRTWQFWLLLLGVLVGNYSLQTHTVVLVPYYDELGFSTAVAASALSVYGLFSLAMRFAWGILAQRLGSAVAMIMQSCLTAVAAIFLLQITGTASLYMATAFTGMMLSGFPPLQILLWPEFFGRRHIGSIVGMTQLFTTFAGAIGPLAAGFVFDQTGTYTTTLWLLVGTWLLCALVMVSVKRATFPEPRAEMTRVRDL
jgi:MFS family permease